MTVPEFKPATRTFDRSDLDGDGSDLDDLRLRLDASIALSDSLASNLLTLVACFQSLVDHVQLVEQLAVALTERVAENSLQVQTLEDSITYVAKAKA
jgi:hypothetical protein